MGAVKVEEIYKKKTPREHVLLRPDMYIGSINSETRKLFVLNETKDKMVQKDITYTPGLLKIFDEILVNAIDNKQRDKTMKYLFVNIDKDTGKIVIFNDGKGIPIKIHKEHKCYIPELIFGHMLTSSNFNDDVKRIIGGRNGYGAKLTNIYSKEFIVETCDGKKTFYQIHKNNMTETLEPKIRIAKKNKNYTRITFIPDYFRFGEKGLTTHCMQLMEKRVYDIAGISEKSLQVRFNDTIIKINGFKNFLSLFVLDTMPILHIKVNERWEIGISISDGHFKQVSYVNSICTTNGGKHTDYVADSISKYIANKKKELKPRQVKDFIFLFVNSLIENPAFKSQTKEELMTKVRDFGSKCVIPESFLKKILKSPIVTEALEMTKHKEARSKARKTDGKKSLKIFGITKLIDARYAGTKRSNNCTLILVEGDSAKTLAVAGIPAIKGEFGQQYYGVYPLRGKLLNVRDANHSQVANNSEITNIKKIIGLKDGVNYQDDKNFMQLRYGKVLIMVDQDYDGSHIKGLLINLFHLYWPSLIKRKGFILEFITPIVVCKKKRNKEKKEFYTLPEYGNWRENINKVEEYDIKYYKGLGTSSNAEAESYFSNLRKHRIDFNYIDSKDDDSIEMAFSKSRVNDRKVWLTNFVPGTFLNQNNVDFITYNDFINKELILFSMADNIRSIPSAIDGLKPGQRKIMFTCLNRNIVKGIKVPQLAGYVMGDTAYHHGDAALQGSIIKLAQCFVGSNNINLLFPLGQFGSRTLGGKDAANARYISAKLSSVTRNIFHKNDEPVLKYLNDDGLSIEPEWFIPIIPMVLVNGAEGIGTGWSTFVPCYNPLDIVENIRLLLDGKEQKKLIPWYKGWNGCLRLVPNKSDCVMMGKIQLIDSHTARITELPVKVWTEPYKNYLLKLMEEGILSNVIEEHNINTVNFVIETTNNHPIHEITEHILKILKLTGYLSTSNMILFDSNCSLKQYHSPEEILKEFFGLRFKFYQKRKDNLIKVLKSEILKIENRVRFIMDIINKKLVVTNRPKSEIFTYLNENGYSMIEKISTKITDDKNRDDHDVLEKNEKGYDYLLSMQIWSLTLERVKKLKDEAKMLNINLEEIMNTSLKQLWIKDLDEFETSLSNYEKILDSEVLKPSKRKNANKMIKKRKIKNFVKRENNSKKMKNNTKSYFHNKKEHNSSLYLKVLKGKNWNEQDIKTLSKRENRNVIKNEKKNSMKNKRKLKIIKEESTIDFENNLKEKYSKKYGNLKVKIAISEIKKNGKLTDKRLNDFLHETTTKKILDEEIIKNKDNSINKDNNTKIFKKEKENGKTSKMINENKWICSKCTYKNDSNEIICIICDNNKGKSDGKIYKNKNSNIKNRKNVVIDEESSDKESFNDDNIEEFIVSSYSD